MVHPQEVLQVLLLRSGPNFPQALKLGQLAAAFLPFLLLQRLVGQEAAQATLHALAHGGQRQYPASGAAADAAAPARSPVVPDGGRCSAAARLGDLRVQKMNKLTVASEAERTSIYNLLL